MSDQYTSYGAGKLAGAAEERDRFTALLDNELNQCTCEDPLRHLRQRVLMIAVKGEGENK